jgi:hypothetical protein
MLDYRYAVITHLQVCPAAHCADWQLQVRVGIPSFAKNSSHTPETHSEYACTSVGHL